MRMTRLALLMVLMFSFSLVLAACGDDDDDDEGSADPTVTTAAAATAPAATPTTAAAATPTEAAAASPTDSDAASPTTQASGPIEIEHSLGTTTLDAPAERVVVLEWTYAEDLLAVGVQPAGVSDVEGYHTWVNVQPTLDDSVTDVGTRQEPSLESIAALEPDLIIGVQFRHEGTYDQLTDIAPTLIFNPYPTDGSMTQYEEMEQTFMAIAKAVGKEAEGQEVLDELHAKFEEAKGELEAAGLLGAEYALAQAYTSEDVPQIRLFIDTALSAEVLNRIGLVNAWEGEPDQFGFNVVGIESLTEVEDANFLYVAQDNDNVFENQWVDNPVWTNLTFYKEDRVYPLGGDTWLFGGPNSMALLVDVILETLIP